MRINSDNLNIRAAAREDQSDRNKAQKPCDLEWIGARDAMRRELVRAAEEKGLLRTAEDFYSAALIFQHGQCLADFIKAHKFAAEAMKCGTKKKYRWLYAASLDRMLVFSGKRQKFGTQYSAVDTGTRLVMQMCNFDRRTSDALRKSFGVPPLKLLIEREEALTAEFFD